VPAPGVLANDNTNGGGAMTAALVSSPSSGSLSLQTDGSFTYLPMSGFVGVDSFTYSAANTNGVSAPATVTIAIAATQNLLSNGSFEQGPAIPSGASYVTIPAGSSALTGWTVTGQNVDYIGPGWAVAHGVRAIDLDGDNALGGVQQGFSTIPGRTYVVSFALAGNPGGPPTIKQLRFSVDGQVHDLTFDSTGRSFPDLGWQRRSFVFVASGSTATVSFVSRSPARNSYGALIDDVVVVSQPPSAQPPTDLYAYAILGNLVTLRWTPPVLGPAPTGYVLEGGVTPGQVLASIPTGSPYPIYSFIAPTGSFYVRVHAATAAGRSAASNEIRIHVNVPVAPSPPSGLVGLVNGSTLDLAWRNTYAGGAASALMLDVTGSFTGSFTLGLTDHVAFGGVPGGTYTLRLRAINAGGASSASNPLTVTFPDVCTGAPATPSGFLVFRNFNQLTAIWDPAPVGPAPTGYVLDVSGAFTGSLQTAARSLGGTVAAGSYSLAVRATNACGSSPPTAAQVVTIP
jgi:choice-of-anchor C domain-containing protein